MEQKQKIWVLISVASLLGCLVLSYMLFSVKDRSKEIEDLKLDRALQQGKIESLKSVNATLDKKILISEYNQKVLNDSINIKNEELKKIKIDYAKKVSNIRNYNDVELVNFFSDKLN